MNKRLYFVGMALVAIMLATGCGILNNLPSVCDDKSSPSLLCDVAEKNDIRLESAGLGIIIVNAALIGEGVYTREQAVSVLIEVRNVFEKSVSYVFARGEMNKALNKYPGMVEVASMFLNEFDSSKIMYRKDREIMITWLDNRIKSLE
jgi:hypothetical protein